MAAARLGFKTHIYDDTTGPAYDVSARHTIGGFADAEALAKFAGLVDVVTYEFENVPVETVRMLEAAGATVRPGTRALEVAQDRLTEKTFIAGLGLGVAPFAALSAETLPDATATVAAWDGPAIVKTRRLGYDGKGQVGIRNADELAQAFAEIGGAPSVVERRLTFLFEVSVLVVRAADGSVAVYDCPENQHAGGILRVSRVPSRLPAHIAEQARAVAVRIAEALGYIGVLAVELFYMGPAADTPLLVNEIAPRVHNSGHWTLDACVVSQFENHIRAVAGWPLGTTARHSDATMHNLIGSEAQAWATLAAEPGAILHLYGKRDARPGRKMGHVNRLSALSRD
jgi:5-(carboxyamino)imidazole ribonucleotide synthase